MSWASIVGSKSVKTVKTINDAKETNSGQPDLSKTGEIVTIDSILDTQQRLDVSSSASCSTACVAVTPGQSDTKSVEVCTSQPTAAHPYLNCSDSEDENAPAPIFVSNSRLLTIDQIPEIPRWTPEVNAQEVKKHRLVCRAIARQMAIDASYRLRRGEVRFAISIYRYVSDTEFCDFTCDMVVQLLVEAGYPVSRTVDGRIRFELVEL